MAAKIWRFIDYFFQNGGGTPFLIGFTCLDHPRRVLGGLYHFLKFTRNRCSSFDNMLVLIFCELILKMRIHASKMRVWDLTS